MAHSVLLQLQQLKLQALLLLQLQLKIRYILFTQAEL